MDGLLNPPPHITDKAGPSAFIPFCFFGDQQIGRVSGNFQAPVCDLFREKIVRGQVCYEADLNQFKKDDENWENALKKGFSFIVDLNEEYYVKHLYEKTSTESSGKKKNNVSTTVYKSTETDKKLNILLKTISMIHIHGS